jgi:hypothetical protein
LALAVLKAPEAERRFARWKEREMTKLTVLAAIVAAILLVPSRAWAAPRNDNFEDAALLGGPPAEVAGTTDGATAQPGEFSYASGMSVWYAFRPAVSQRVGIEAYTDVNVVYSNDVYLSVSTGSTLASLHQLGSDDAENPRVEFDAAAGTTYWVMVASEDSTTFTLRTTTTTPPANDFFSAARRVKVGVDYSGSFADATGELGEPAETSRLHSVWFRFHAPRNERITVDSGESEATNELFVFTGIDISDARLIAIGGGGSPTGAAGDVVRFEATRGRSYHIALGGQSPHNGEYKLWISDGGVKGKGLTMDIAPGQTVASVRQRGLSAVINAKRLVKIKLELLVSRSLAHRLRLGTPVLGSVKGSVDYGQQLTANIDITPAARRALRSRRTLTATLRLVILDRSAPDRVLTKMVALGS